MFTLKDRFLAGTILSAVALGSVHSAPLDAAIVVAQAPAQTEQDKDKDKKPPPRRGPPQQQQQQPPQQRPQAPPPRQQQRQVQPPPGQERPVQPQPPERREVRPPPQERRVQPQPPAPEQRQVQPPRQDRQVQPPTQQQPPSAPQQRQVEPQPSPGAPSTTPPQQRQVQPPPSQKGQPPAPQQRQVQPPPGQQQVQPPPSAGSQPPTGSPPATQQQPGVQPGQQRGIAGPTGQPPKPVAPQQPIGAPTIAPSALQPQPPPAQSPAAQTQRAFVPPPSQDNARRLDDVRGARHEIREGDRVLIQEPGRVIIREGGRTIIRHNEIDRFRWQARDAHVERRGSETVTVFVRSDGSRVFSVTDESGRLLRRYRRAPDGREIVIIDNRYSGPPRIGGYFVDLPPPMIRIPRERYIVDTQYAQPNDIYYALWAAPVERLERAYTLDEVRYSPSLRERMPRIDVDTVTFDTGSWEVTPDQVERLAVIADGINRAIAANPSEVFLIEGHTDAVGSDIDNLSLSDRRAESVALVLSQQFGVPAENLTTQGYGEQQLKVPTQGPERANRRVAVRRITPLLTGQNEAVPLR
jgi:outer membrane protein OmpA-like peptidoglycan-associated protein